MTPDEYNEQIREAIESLRAAWGDESLPIDDQFNMAVRLLLLTEMWQFEVDLCDRMAQWIATVRSTVNAKWIGPADQLIAEWSELRASNA